MNTEIILGVGMFTAVILASTMTPTGTPLNLMAKRVVKPTVAFARKAFNQVLKKEMITSEMTSPMTESSPSIMSSIIVLG